MTYKVTEEGDTSTVFLDGEIDMDKTEGAKEIIDQIGGWSSSDVGESFGDGFDMRILHKWTSSL